MELDDFGGAFGGAIGGLVKWYQEPNRPLKVVDYVSSLVTSLVGAGICGYTAREVVEWQYPNVPQSVTFALSMVVGLGSGPILQSVVGLSSLVVARVRDWLLAKLPTPPAPSHGLNPPAGQQPGPAA